jgi:hypothetical protein
MQYAGNELLRRDTIPEALACGKNQRKTGAAESDKRRQRICRNLPPFNIPLPLLLVLNGVESINAFQH